MTNSEILSNYLKNHGVKPSIQRLKIYEILRNNVTHPTADEIFNHLVKEIPTLSLATVYNTMHLFEQKELVRIINIENHQARFDWNMKPHGHFQCNVCGTIYDIEIDTNQMNINELDEYQLEESHFYFKGLCKTCLNK
ncbi:MAG: transcriptional repressor [Bacteroidales bacterium]|nr:transcriptional repressor [Bacteroidales bacterium]